jgi:outer membrane protein OmpA-like peptidoglycan-associated protein
MKQLVRTSALVLLAMAVVACGETLPPKELVDARAALERAQKGDAQRLKPAQVYEAKQALDRAEDRFKETGDSMETKDLAYVAHRKAELAEAEAEIAIANDAKLKAVREKEDLVKQALSSTQGELSKTKQQLEAERRKLEEERKKLEDERAARLEAERRLKQAIDDLAKIAAVKEESRGMVITLSGAVLFASGKWELLPAAQVKLNEVASALNSSKDRDIVVEGHTDNQGTVQSNLELAQKRADAVRDYLISRGIDAARIKATGIGQARPIADNASPEGRANNRRVEIIVSPPREAR